MTAGARPTGVRPAPPPRPERALRAGVVAGIAFGLLGWRGLLVASLVRSIEPGFGRGDAELGTYFLATALAYATGSLLGGRLIHVRGPRFTLPIAALVMSAGLATQGLTASWLVFALAGITVSLGASTCDMGINALVLDLFPHARGRALNLLHLMYSAAALAAPLALAFAVGAGVPWQQAFLGSAIAALVIAAALAATVPSHRVLVAVVARPSGSTPAAKGDAAADGPVAGLPAGTSAGTSDRRLPRFLLVIAVAIGCYVAAESGTSDWLIRYLEALPIAIAGTALTMFWGGIAVGRVVFARIGNRMEPLRTAAGMAMSAAVLMLVAVLLPVSPVSPVLFGLAGIAFGPVFPLAVAAAGARMPGRSATVTTTLTFAAVVGAILYPPAMGFMSVTVGLQVAMLGTVGLLVACGAVAFVARRVTD